MALQVKDAYGSVASVAVENNTQTGTVTPHSAPEVNGAVVSTANPMPTVDANGAAFQGVVTITPGTPVAAARSLGYVCTASGNVTLTLADGSTVTLALQASTSLQTLPFAVTNVTLGSGTAGSFWNLK